MKGYLNSQSLNVVGTVCSACEIGQVELDLIPAIVESHGHGTDEGLDSSRALVVAGTEATSHILVVQDLHLEGEVLLQVLDDHDQKGQLDAQRFLRVGGTCDVCGADIGANDLQDQRLDVVVGDTLDVAVAYLLVPDLERLGADRVQDGQKSTLESVFKHLFSSVFFVYS